MIPINYMMKISSINGVAKKAALGAMLFSSVAMFATNPNRATRTDNPPQTEVVSKDGAAALKATPQQQNPAVPTVHNKALDEKFLKLADTEEEKQYVNNLLSSIYTKNGSYLGSAMVQQNIDVNMFLEFLDGNIEILKRFDEEAYNKIDREAMQKVVEKSEPIKQWLNENYFAVYNKPFQFDHMPDAEELNVALDNYIEKDPYQLFMNFTGYKFDVTNYKSYLKKSNMDNIQKNSTFIAAKVHTANELLFLNLLKQHNLYITSNNGIFVDNFKIWIDATRAIKYY